MSQKTDKQRIEELENELQEQISSCRREHQKIELIIIAGVLAYFLDSFLDLAVEKILGSGFDPYVAYITTFFILLFLLKDKIIKG